MENSYQEIWDSTFEKYKDDFNEFSWISQNIDSFVLNVIENIDCNKENALDIACGMGMMSEFLSNHFSNVVAVDVSRYMIDRCNKDNKKVSYLTVDFFKYQSNVKFDFVVSHFFLEVIQPSDVNDFFKKVFGFLNHSGYFLLTCFLSPSDKMEIRKSNYKHQISLYTQNNIAEFTKDYFDIIKHDTTMFQCKMGEIKVGLFLLKYR